MIIKTKKNGFFERRIMPLARAVENNKFKAFLVMYCVWLIDIGSTAIALGLFSDSFYEGNPLADYFFSWGVIGWPIWMVICASLIWFLLYLPNIFMKIEVWLDNDKKPAKIRRLHNHYNLLRLLNVCGVIISESLVIISNIRLLIGII
jgi:hypothetical protein